MSAIEIIPSLQYKDAKNAIEWLCNTWGFKKHLIVEGKDGKIEHSQLSLGKVMIMVSSKKSGTPYGNHTAIPEEVGNRETQAPYLVVDDPDWFYNKAKNNSAKIVVEIKDEDYGGRGFSCTDLESHLWSFGSYNPRNPTTYEQNNKPKSRGTGPENEKE
mmetsp:Transcript_18580/g.22727  ORF Transcript_18580/g.22727 Transcript_18580/m.22727 type:complete len:159 (+) Transcript_18580:75-551(+)|eukprot:CAMPEP_0204831526 /NCGR_PEP_ID=MMETSP1346-20131115/10835_1 /ASSEMBLY_ACC=CAM_ASM_000771 /TAXON_ID=215587 /ORGANISM="Aplanochytrium stocchinoi, Strain GSBS06" /LENGTH=158 /DNA_ID=CAMNT_0051962619 /DNA_START=149 /DNA_END=625 /DNA_ORIENTATION=+